jgi:hypothetical protein
MNLFSQNKKKQLQVQYYVSFQNGEWILDEWILREVQCMDFSKKFVDLFWVEKSQ